MHFDPTINLGNILSGVTFLALAMFTWRDLTWRIKNLETWRKEHQIDANARDELIGNMKEILNHVRWQTDRMLGIKDEPPPPTRH
jgi:hypothetical protein